MLALPEMHHHLLVGPDSDLELAREQTSVEQVRVLQTLVRPVSPRRDLASVVNLRRILRHGRYDVVFSHQSKAGVVSRMAAPAARGPIVVHSLSMASFGPGYGRVADVVFRRMERMLGGRTAAFCVVGTDLADRYAALGVPTDRLHIVRSGVPLPSQVLPREDARRLLCERYGVPPGRPLICFVGSLEPRKNAMLLPDVLLALSSRLPTPPFLLVAGDGPQRSMLEARLRELGLEQHAVLTGHVSEAQHISDALRGADLVLLLSKAEGLPQVLVQSAAEGTPFVAFEVEGVREVLSLGAAGAVVPRGDLAGVVDTAYLALTGLRPVPAEPVADLSSWSPESIRSAYRNVMRKALGESSAPDGARLVSLEEG